MDRLGSGLGQHWGLTLSKKPSHYMTGKRRKKASATTKKNRVPRNPSVQTPMAETEIVYLGGNEPEPEPKPALSVPAKITVEQAKDLMPWSTMTNDQLQAEIDAVWAFSAGLAALISKTDQEHVNWVLSDDPADDKGVLA
jgi:hypothetical protein